jgi:DNA-binding transcriptional MerR regulator
MNKSADAFRTISEVASLLEVPKHVLRFWESKFPQIKPMKRGGGRRYYRPEDLDLLCGIRQLLHADGYTIKGVQRILRQDGVDAVKEQGKHSKDFKPSKPAAKRKASRTKTAKTANSGSKPTKQSAKKVDGSAKETNLDSIIRELEACRALLKPASAKVAPGRKAAAAATSRRQQRTG